jgi:hypothetical protein
MSITGLIVALIITLALLWVFALPFIEPASQLATVADVERQRERLKLYYERVLRNIHDLDEDHLTGKLNPDEYQSERERWVQRGVAALKAIESIDAEHLIISPSADVAALDEAIDRTLTLNQPENSQRADASFNP